MMSYFTQSHFRLQRQRHAKVTGQPQMSFALLSMLHGQHMAVVKR